MTAWTTTASVPARPNRAAADALSRPARVVGPVIRRRAGKTTANSDTPTSSAMWPAVQAGPGPWSGSLSRMIP
ncbi:hypothetical protein [Streptomyces sp. NBC_01233]|uniref:hypothetical protein n=1 Tax=Streptomyces sp. NBC_01233 TaxID=2903787 RepID=UPI002E0EF857|nr:hypothetical protein OG332_14165 [Streptomyces sp. NBC_01233]